MFIVVVSSLYLTNTVRSTLDSYLAEEAEATISTRVIDVRLKEKVETIVQGAKLFLFELKFEVWNSYPSPQTVIVSSSCGIEPDVYVDYQGQYYAPVEFLSLRESCTFVESKLRFDVGVTPVQAEYFLKIDKPDIDDLLLGTYFISYSANVEDSPKFTHFYIAKLDVTSDGKTVIYDPVPDNYGEVDPESRIVPISATPLFALLPLIAIVKRRKDQLR